MRLLTEYMSVPEANGGIVANKTIDDDRPAPASNEPESIESRNLKLARQIEAHKSQLIHALSKFPVTALWVLSRYEQAPNKDEQEDDTNVASEYNEFLEDIKKQYQAVKLAFVDKAQNEEVYASNRQQLMLAVQQFPFAFEDLVKVVDIVVYAFKYRGISFDRNSFSSNFPGNAQAKRYAEIILKRLEGVARHGKTSLAEQFKAMDLHQHEEEYLFLSITEMSELMADAVLAEHHWLAYRQNLATVNSKLVLFIANQYRGSFLDFEDLVQEGHTGLLKAVDRFKYRLGFQFSTYAGYWIRQAISRTLSRSERVVRIPCGQIATINKLFRAKEELSLKTGKEPSIQELAEYTQLSHDEVNGLLSISQSAVALEAFEDDESEQAFAPIDFLEQKVFNHSYNMIAEAQLQSIVKTAVKALNTREAKILCSHFGVGTDEQMTLQEIGVELNLTRERVRQIQVVALDKIRMRYGEQLLSFL
jgi:RNA polymerase primary sigma factor